MRMHAVSIFLKPVAAARQVLYASPSGPEQTARPVGAWVVFGALAVTGSIIYGASVARVVPGWTMGRGGLWMLLSAALSWAILGYALMRLTRTPLSFCIHVCLVTLVYGVAILQLGALLNWALVERGFFDTFDPVRYNIMVVGVSNIVMALVLAEQMAVADIGFLRSVVIWVLFLNGSGAVSFWAFHYWPF